MKDLWKTMRLAAYIFALPLVATAAVSGHQLFQNDDPVSVVATPKVETNDTELVGLNDTYRQHTLAINENGQVSGRVWAVDSETNTKYGLADTKVFFVRDGEIASQVYTDPDGTFDVSGLVEGAYSFVVSNLEGVAVYGVNVVENGAVGDMEVVVVSKNASKAQKALNKDNEPTKSSNLTTEMVRGSNVAQLVDGQLEGQLHATYANVDFSGTSVEIFDGSGNSVGSTEADAKGNFEFSGLTSGYYEFVASGPQGFATFGFEAVAANASYTSLQDGGFDTMLTTPVDYYYIVEGNFQEDDDDGFIYFGSSPVEFAGSYSSGAGAFNSFGGGGFGGGGFGGGGFGGAGIGRLLAVAGLAVGIVAIADDNNTDPGGATPVTN